MPTEQVVTEIIVDSRKAKEGIEGYTEALSYAGDATDEFGVKITGGFNSAEKAANAYLMKLDPVFNASQKLGAEAAKIATAIDGLARQFQRGMDPGVYNEHMLLLQRRMKDVQDASSGLAAGTVSAGSALATLTGHVEKSSTGFTGNIFLMRTLARESVGMFSALATGAPVFSALSSSLTRIGYDLTLSRRGFRELVGEIGTFFSGAGLLATVGVITAAVSAALVGLGLYSEGAARKQADLRIQLSATREDYATLARDVQEAAKKVSAATSASYTDAAAAAKTIAGSVFFSGSANQLTELTKTAEGLSQVLGIKVPEAAAKITAGMADPTKTSKELADGLRTLDSSTLALIMHFQQTGDRARAADIFLDAIKRSAKAAEDNITPLQRALNGLATEISSLVDPTARFGKSLGEIITGAAAEAIAAVTEEIKKLREIVSGTDKNKLTGQEAAKALIAGDDPNDWIRALKLAADTLARSLGRTPELDRLQKELKDLEDTATRLKSGEGVNVLEGIGLGDANLEAVDKKLQAIKQRILELTNVAVSGGTAGGTGGTPGNIAMLPSQISDAARLHNLDPAFLTALQRSENAGLNAQGMWPTSPTGRVGPFQLDPKLIGGMQRNAADYPTMASLPAGASASEQGTNVEGAGAFAAHVLRKYYPIGGLELAIVAWNVGETVMDKFLAGTGPKPSEEAYGLAKKVMSQYSGTGFGFTGGVAAGQGLGFTADDKVAALRAVTEVMPGLATDQKKIDDLNKSLRDMATRKKELTELPTVLTPEEASFVNNYDKAIAQLNVDLLNAKDPTRQATLALQDQAKTSSMASAAARELADIHAKYAREREAHPMFPPSQAAEAAEINAVIARQSGEYVKLTNSLALQITQQDKVADAWKNGAAGAAEAEAKNKAYDTVLQQLGTTTTPQAIEAQKALAGEYDAVAAGANKIKANQESFSNQHQIDMLQTEISTLGMASDERELYLKHKQDDFDLTQKFPQEAMEPYRRALLAERDELASLSQVYARTQRDLNYLADAFTSAFTTIGNAITESFVQGGAAAVNWGNVMKSVLSQVIQQFLQLSILNPILNTLFPSTQVRPTLGGMLGSLGNIGGGGGGIGGALSAVGAIGGIVGGAGGGFTGGATNPQEQASVFNYMASIGQLGAVAGGGGGGGGGALGMASNVSNLFSMQRLSNIWSSITPNFGVSGPFSGGGMLGNLGGISAFMGTPMWAGSLPATAGFSAVTGGFAPTFSSLGLSAGETGLLGAAGVSAPTGGGLAAAGVPTATIGGLVSGVGLGFGAGSLAGGLIQGAMNKVGPAPQIGAGAGAIAGAVIGSIIPVIGTVIGGLIGGLIGGAGGGFIGPRPASPFSSIPLSIGPGGQLQASDLISQKVDAQALATQTFGNVNWLNSVMGAHGLGLSGLGGISQIGTNTPGGFQDPTKAADFATAFTSMQFTQAGPGGALFQGRTGFKDIQQLSDTAVAVEQFVATLQQTNAADRISDFLGTLGSVAIADIPSKLTGIVTFITDTVPTLLGDKNIGSLNDAIAKINTTFAPAIQMAQELTYKEAELTAARDKQIATAIEATQTQEAINNQGLRVRYATALAQITGDTGQAAEAQMQAFDLNAQQQRMQMTQHLKEVYGDTITQTKDYTDIMGLLEVTLGAERLAAQKQFNVSSVNLEKQHQADIRAQQQLEARYQSAHAQVTRSPADAFNAQIYAFDTQAQAAREDMAQSLADALIGGQDFANHMAMLERALGEERLGIVRAYNLQTAAAWEANFRIAEGLASRRVNAMAALGQVTPQQAELYNFEISARQQRIDLENQIVGSFGNAYKSTADFADRMAQLEQTLADERLAIQKKYNDQATQMASGVLTSLAEYARNLQFNAASPLSPQAQYKQATSQFNAVSGAAIAGDFTSIQKLQSFSDAFLNASRGVYGSGASYAADFQRVINALNAVGSIPQDTFTAAVYTAEMRTQTQQLVDSQSNIANLLKSILTALEQGKTAPARAAA